MPNIKSAKKRLKQSIVRNTNRAAKHTLSTKCKKVLAAVSAGSVEQAEAEMSQAAKLLDKSAAKKVIHRNAAARKKLCLSAKIKKLKGK